MPHLMNLQGCIGGVEGRDLEFVAQEIVTSLPMTRVVLSVFKDVATKELLIGAEVESLNPRVPSVEMWASAALGLHVSDKSG